MRMRQLASLAFVMTAFCTGCASLKSGPSLDSSGFPIVAANDESDFISLFDGQTLNGWEGIRREPDGELPADCFSVQDGMMCIKGYGHKAGAPWIRYATPLSDCVIRMEYKCSPGANSGLVLKSKEEGVPWQSGFEVQILDDHGQAPSKNGAGSIYDVVTPMYNASKPTGEWNQLEVTCYGSLVKVVLNGFKVIDTDFSKLTTRRGKASFPYAEMPQSGYLALQDHGYPMWFRNIRMKPLSRPRGMAHKPAAPCSSSIACSANEHDFKVLFDGTSLKGWEVIHEWEPAVDPNTFSLQDSTVYNNGKGGAWLRYAAEQFGDFVLRLEFKITKGSNSGVCLRTPKKGPPPYITFEVQIEDDQGKDAESHISGAIYDVVTPMYNASRPLGEWNQMEITCKENKCRVILNGLKVIDTDFDLLTTPRGKFNFPYKDLPRRGYITLQDHGTPVWYRNIRIKTLDACP